MGVGELRGGRIKRKGKRTHGHGQQRGDCWRVGGIRGLSGNGKNTIKNFKRSRMYLIISVKAVFILIWHLLVPSISPFLRRACRNSNYLMTWVPFVISRVWALLKPKLNLQAENEDAICTKELPSWGMRNPPFLYKVGKIKKWSHFHPVFLNHKIWTL